MAEEKIILDVDIKATNALKELGDLKEQINRLKAEQKALDTSTKEGQREYNRLGEQIKAVNKAVNERSRTIQQEIKQQNAAAGSLKQMRQHLAEMKDEYAELSAADRESDFGRGLLENIGTINQKLKDAEAEYGVYTRNVGNYAKEVKNVSAELGEVTQELMAMAAAGDRNSEAYQELVKKAANLKSAQDEVNKEIDRMGKGSTNIEGVTSAMNGVVGAVGAITGGLKILGVESEHLDRLQGCMGEFMVVMQGLTTVQEAFNKQSAAYTLVTKLQTLAQKKLNITMSANPVGVLVAGITALVAAVYGAIKGITQLVKVFTGVASAEEEAEVASRAYEKQAQQTADTITKTNQQIESSTAARQIALNKELTELITAGASETALQQARAKADEEMTDDKMKAAQTREKALEAEKAKLATLITATENLNGKQKEGSKAHKESTEKLNEYNARIVEINKSLQEEATTMSELNLHRAESAKKALEEAAAVKKAEQEKWQARMDAAAKSASQYLDQAKALADEEAKQTATSLSEDFYTRQAWEAQEYARREEYEKKKLDIQKQYGQITLAEYDNQMTLISARRATFEAEQTQSIIQHNVEQAEAIKTILTSAQDLELQHSAEKYDQQIAQLQAYGQQVADEYDALNVEIAAAGDEATQAQKDRLAELDTDLMNQGEAIVTLEEQKEQAKKEIQDRYNAQAISDRLATLDEQYKIELLDCGKNEAAKLETTKNYAKQRLAILSELYGEESLQYKEAAAALQQAMDDVNKHNEESAAASVQKIADEYAKIADSIGEWGGKAVEMFSAVNDLMSAEEDAQLQQYEENNEARKASLQERLDAGVISQEEYNAGVKAADADYEKQKAEIDLKQAKRQKAISLTQATIAGMQSIANAVNAGMQFGPAAVAMVPVLVALATALTAVQIAAIAKQPLPKAARGMLVGHRTQDAGQRTQDYIPVEHAASGGYLAGPSHEQGGIPIEAEGGEVIINKRSAAMYRPLLSKINQAGGGVRFAAGGIVGSIPDGGTTARAAFSGNDTMSLQLDKLGDRIENMRIFTAVEDINTGQKRYANVQSGGVLD